MCARLRGGLVSRRELDQSGFAESCPEEANAERHAKYYARRNLNNGVTWRRGQPRRSEDEMVTIDQVSRPGRVIGRGDDCIEVKLADGCVAAAQSATVRP